MTHDTDAQWDAYLDATEQMGQIRAEDRVDDDPNEQAVSAALAWMTRRREYDESNPPVAITPAPGGGLMVEFERDGVGSTLTITNSGQAWAVVHYEIGDRRHVRFDLPLFPPAAPHCDKT